MENQKVFVSWEEFGKLVEELTEKIKKENQVYDGIFGIPRGGIPIAVALSHRLNLPLLLYPSKNSLVVDDISDTGKTLKSHKNKKIATLYTTKWTVTKPDFFVLEKLSQENWIIFPWENKDLERSE